MYMAQLFRRIDIRLSPETNGAMARPTLLQITIEGYRLIELLGAGGMGEVYRAIDTRSNRVVAIKVLARRDPGFLARFRNEARIQAELRHENIATFYHFAEYEGRPCIVMECVEGRTLYQHLAADGPFPVSQTLAIFQSVVEAIAYMHDHRIVHRDIKASNIKITPEGQVKLLDFGIAKGPSSPGLTATGAVIGTPSYLSPEQIKGRTADVHSDIWALGVLLYEMLTGHVPFEANNFLDLYGKISKAVFVPPSVLNPKVTSAMEAIVARCLKKKPADRYATAHDLQKAVTRVARPRTRSFRKPVRRMQNMVRQGYDRVREVLGGALGKASPKPSTPKPAPPAYSPPKRPTTRREVEPSALSPGVKRGGMALVAVVLLAMIVYFLADYWGGPGPGNDAASTLLHCTSDSTRQEGTHTVKIKVMSGSRRARVLNRDGAVVGATPCWIRGVTNTKATFTLQQGGFRDKTIYVDFHERRAEYIIPMDRAGR